MTGDGDQPPDHQPRGAGTTYRAVSPRARRFTLLLLATAPVLAVVVGVVVLLGSPGAEEEPAAAPLDTAPATTYGAEAPELDRSRAERLLDTGHVGLKVTRPQILRTRPAADGQVVGRALRTTSYGGPQILPITKARGDWVAVVSPFRRNNEVSWTKVDADASYVSIDYSISVRVAARSIVVRKNGEVIKRFRSAVGQKTHPTPTGRFAVTDGLIFSKATRGPYGCCALVLSARQTELPDHWQGGDRIAIHGTPNKESIGFAASLGCLRVGDEASRWLVNKVPPGTTVFVKP